MENINQNEIFVFHKHDCSVALALGKLYGNVAKNGKKMATVSISVS